MVTFFITLVVYVKHMKKSKWLDCQGNEFFPKTKGDSITGQDRAQKHCDFRFSQIEKKSKVAVLQLFSALDKLLGQLVYAT